MKLTAKPCIRFARLNKIKPENREMRANGLKNLPLLNFNYISVAQDKPQQIDSDKAEPEIMPAANSSRA
jgi:hypothetical protein